MEKHFFLLQPHSARSCELALRAVGAARGHPGGAPLAWLWGARGRALFHPRPPVLWGVRPGPATHWLWVRGVRAWGPVTNPTARSCELALRAVGAARGHPGGAPLAWLWGVRGRALSREGAGARTPRERERTHTQRTREEDQKGNRTEPVERTDRMEWRTSERG